jgi:hypothetical protein
MTLVPSALAQPFARIGHGIASILVPSIATADAREDDVEVKGKRTRNAKIFLRPDGTHYAKIWAGPVHYLDADGKWQEIDSNLVADAGRHHNTANDLALSIADDASEQNLVAVSGRGGSISFGLAQASGRARAVGNRQSFANALDGIDIDFAAYATGLKEILTLRKFRTEFVFPLSYSGVTPRLTADGSIDFLDGAGTAVYRIPHGTMEDSADLPSGSGAESSAVQYELTGPADRPNGLRVVLDANWLQDPQRVWPILVDPTITQVTDYDDTYIQSDSGNPKYLDTELRSGQVYGSVTSTVARSLLYFPLPGALSGNR